MDLSCCVFPFQTGLFRVCDVAQQNQMMKWAEFRIVGSKKEQLNATCFFRLECFVFTIFLGFSSGCTKQNWFMDARSHVFTSSSLW